MTLANLPNIYNFKDPVIFLERVYQFYKSKDEDFSVRKWAKIMEITSAESLMEVMKGKKKISSTLSEQLCKGLKFDASEAVYFETMVKYASAISVREKDIFELVLTEIAQLKGTKILVEDQNIFSHWVHMAILSMSRVKGILCTKETIGIFLLEKVSQEKIDEAVDRLLGLGLIEYNERGSLIKKYDHTTSKNDAFQKSPHTYFEQVSELAKAGAKIPADEREFQCFSLPIRHEQIPMFKEALRQFRAKVAALADTENADQVYQFNLQFFPLTEVAESFLKDKSEQITY